VLEHERRYWNEFPAGLLAGVDEVGRGPLAGPVVAAAVLMSPALAEKGLTGDWRGLTDSKRLSSTQRDEFCQSLLSHPEVSCGIGWVSASEIDELNVLYATYRAMAQAVKALEQPPDHVLVDGLPVQGLPCPSTAIVQGDAASFLIAAASVVAKVQRDNYMCQLDQRYPGYSFCANKGYGTTAHIEALMNRGPCPEHRRSFRPVAESLQLRLA